MRSRCPLCVSVGAVFAIASALPVLGAFSPPKAPIHPKAVRVDGPKVQRRWIYISTNLLVPENVTNAQTLMRRAKAAGYNGVLLADYKLQILDRMGPEYIRNAEAIRDTARELGMEIIPAVCPVGYSNGLLSHDPNLAEGLPVREAPFLVRGGTADIAPDPAAGLPGGDFETADANKFAGWTFQDAPGTATFADRSVVHGGTQSLRMQDIAASGTPGANARVMRTITVAPFRQYHLSVWIRTQDFEAPGDVRSAVLDTAGRALAFPQWRVERTQEWAQYHVVFNSLNNTQVNLYLGVWGGKGGRIWWDDARFEPIGLLNVLRRDGCPLVVKGEDGTVYEEGRDFEAVHDDRMGTIPWPGEYEVYHTPPVLRLIAGSRIPDGARLRVSYHHAMVINDGQVSCCLSEPKVYTLLQDQIERVNAIFHPKTFMMSHDEIRIANWCDACRNRNLSPGELLADNTRRCIAMIRAVNPKARIAVWSDMYDPYHNAVESYYLVNGSLLGSWRGLPMDIVIANWNFGERAKSPAWFAKRGHEQVIAGYYDDSPDQIRTWLNATRGVPGVDGVMYTTWASRYDDLEAFARTAWGAGAVAPSGAAGRK